jgi:hypothetical protein
MNVDAVGRGARRGRRLQAEEGVGHERGRAERAEACQELATWTARHGRLSEASKL